MKRVVLCGVSHRGLSMYVEPILTTFRQTYSVVGLLDVDPLRLLKAEDTYETQDGDTTGDITGKLQDEFPTSAEGPGEYGLGWCAVCWLPWLRP